jgi:hypothetical protein
MKFIVPPISLSAMNTGHSVITIIFFMHFFLRVSAGAENFSLHHRVQHCSGAHPASYPMSTKGSFPGDEATGA